MTNRPTKATDAPTKRAEPDPDAIALRYTGKGMGAWLHNVPARDLTHAEVEDLAARKVATARELLDSACYEEA